MYIGIPDGDNCGRADVTALSLYAQRYLDWKVVIYVHLSIYPCIIYPSSICNVHLSIYNVYHLCYIYAMKALLLYAQHHLDWKVLICIYIYIYIYI